MSKDKLLEKWQNLRDVGSRYTTEGKILLQDKPTENNSIVAMTIQNYHHRYLNTEKEPHENTWLPTGCQIKVLIFTLSTCGFELPLTSLQNLLMNLMLSLSNKCT